jgi:lipopolysaccharide transport system permease protein
MSPHSHWFDLSLRELWAARELILLFVWRDFVALYKQTVLGPLWYIAQPVMTTVVFTVVFGRIAKLSTEGVPQFLFYMSGTIVWGYFSACLMKTSTTFITNSQLFGKVYFPRLVVPLSLVISNLITFGVQFAVFLGFVAYFALEGSSATVTWAAALLPVLMVIMAALGMGLGIIVSAVTTRYRDLQYLVQFGTMLLMYVTPIVYPLSSVTGPMRTLLLLNPMTAVVETFREGFLGAGTASAWGLVYSASFSAIALFVGALLFHRVERVFMDTI